ncbi:MULTISPECIES: hypothetical protein [Paraburkholderia]|uniref:hypothetical protein n=1 Tax=Paraburkholderia TaxID=1822464 RepID=UPI001CC387D0|nr:MULTISPECIES: hypothetical protein [Paraburkholderia]
MDILIGTWRTFVLCTTHSAQSKSHGASEKIIPAQSGFHLLDDGALMRVRERETHQTGVRTPCDGAFFVGRATMRRASKKTAALRKQD